ncbi:MAG: SMC-Scp complex subunit ScpB [Elusimicrobiota bacterium]|jgi:segregation and condensation protein B|nr:SMC-Scp complex subunit ScpB [Elusimicrobiota bacterium]
METSEAKKVLEALLFVSDRPLALKEFKVLLTEDYADLDNIENLINELKEEYASSDKPYEIRFVADGWTFATKVEYSGWIRKLLNNRKPIKLSHSALEVLAITAYKQPISRGDIDEIRGVDSSWVLDTLVERKLIKIVGRKESLGRPLLYGTTQEFLKHFGLAHLSDMPLIDSQTLEKVEDRLMQKPVPDLQLYDENGNEIIPSVDDVDKSDEQSSETLSKEQPTETISSTEDDDSNINQPQNGEGTEK